MSQQDPYAYDPNAAQRNQQPQGYPPPNYGQPGYPMQPYATPYQRPVWKVVVAVILFVLAGLMILGQLAQLGMGNTVSADQDPAYLLGRLIGVVLFIGLPILIGVLLLRKPKQYR